MENTKYNITQYICEWCGKQLATQASLKKHLSTTRSCLKIQEKELIGVRCHYCNRKFTVNASLIHHIEKCEKYIEYKHKEEIGNIKKILDNRFYKKENKYIK